MHYHRNASNRYVGPILVHVSSFLSGVDKYYFPDLNNALCKMGVFQFLFKENVPYVEYGLYAPRRVWFYDGCGDLICPTELEAVVKDIIANRLSLRFRYGKRHVSDSHFRRYPVPNISNTKGRGRYFRSVRTHQELRSNLAVMDDDIRCYGVRVRGKRKNIPTDYDDISYTRRGDNWKHYRKTQWK